MPLFIIFWDKQSIKNYFQADCSDLLYYGLDFYSKVTKSLFLYGIFVCAENYTFAA